jgi:hypothetical protein
MKPSPPAQTGFVSLRYARLAWRPSGVHRMRPRTPPMGPAEPSQLDIANSGSTARASSCQTHTTPGVLPLPITPN